MANILLVGSYQRDWACSIFPKMSHATHKKGKTLDHLRECLKIRKICQIHGLIIEYSCIYIIYKYSWKNLRNFHSGHSVPFFSEKKTPLILTAEIYLGEKIGSSWLSRIENNVGDEDEDASTATTQIRVLCNKTIQKIDLRTHMCIWLFFLV